jgi:ParB/RepB/Spo0J family partition protein
VLEEEAQSKEAQPEEEAQNEEELTALELPGAERLEADIKDIPLDDIAELSNVRQAYHGIEGLAETLHLEGQLQPCLVRPAQDETHGKSYELVFGYRRKRAAEYLREQEIEGWETLRCLIEEVKDGEELSKMIVENFQREKPSPVAEARAMLALKHSVDPPMTNTEVGRRLGCHRSQVAHRLSILSLGQTPALPKAKEALPPAQVDQEATKNEQGESIESSNDLQASPEADQDDKTENEEGQEGAPEGQEGAPEGQEDVQEAAPEQPKVDILELVDQGKISASTAEVIAGIDSREDQEKLAQLVVRQGWGSKRAAAWARQLEKAETLKATQDMGEVEYVEMADLVELPRLVPKEGISATEVKQLNLYILLRSTLDREMIEYLEVELGVHFNELWDYVKGLDSKEVEQLTERMILRYISAAHRYHDLEPSLQEQFADPAQTELPEELADIEGFVPGVQVGGLADLFGGEDDPS